MISLEHVNLSFGEKTVFRDFSCEFEQGSSTAVTGPSGVGKTSLLRLLSQGLKPDSGSIQTGLPLAVMFQEPRLLPWFSVRENLTAVLGKGSDAAALEWLARVQLETEADSLPASLSGGMQQRVSLARTLAYASKTNAGLILLDEPFSALDPELHRRMRDLTLEVLKGKTVLLITHDAEDAAACDRQLVLGSCN